MINKEKQIDISVVVPAFNEEHILALCIEALQKQDFKGTFEIIIVDNNSSDKTVEIAKKLGVRVIHEKRKGVAFARQSGFMASRGKVIASTDADTIVPANWLSTISSTFKKYSNISAVTGPIDFFGQTKRRLFFLNTFAPITRFVGLVFSGEPYFYGANFAIKKDIFQKIGGFDTRLSVGEDMDLGIHAAEFGEIKYLSNLRVRTSARKWEHELSSTKGIRYLFSAYMFNFWSFIIFRKPRVSELKDIRTRGNHQVLSEKSLKIM